MYSPAQADAAVALQLRDGLWARPRHAGRHHWLAIERHSATIDWQRWRRSRGRRGSAPRSAHPSVTPRRSTGLCRCSERRPGASPLLGPRVGVTGSGG